MKQNLNVKIFELIFSPYHAKTQTVNGYVKDSNLKVENNYVSEKIF